MPCIRGEDFYLFEKPCNSLRQMLKMCTYYVLDYAKNLEDDQECHKLVTSIIIFTVFTALIYVSSYFCVSLIVIIIFLANFYILSQKKRKKIF